LQPLLLEPLACTAAVVIHERGIMRGLVSWRGMLLQYLSSRGGDSRLLLLLLLIMMMMVLALSDRGGRRGQGERDRCVCPPPTLPILKQHVRWRPDRLSRASHLQQRGATRPVQWPLIYCYFKVSSLCFPLHLPCWVPAMATC
jgi:hypothetical protein